MITITRKQTSDGKMIYEQSSEDVIKQFVNNNDPITPEFVQATFSEIIIPVFMKEWGYVYDIDNCLYVRRRFYHDFQDFANGLILDSKDVAEQKITEFLFDAKTEKKIFDYKYELNLLIDGTWTLTLHVKYTESSDFVEITANWTQINCEFSELGY